MIDTAHLYHYFEQSGGPFRSLTALSFEEAAAIQRAKRDANPRSVNPNIEWFLTRRYEMERAVRDAFIALGGKPARTAPIYCTLGPNEGLKTWFAAPAWVKSPVSELGPDSVSFTYGDTFAVFNPALDTGEEYWGRVYRYDDIVKLIDRHGLPGDPPYDMKNWVFPKGKPINQILKYIEAHVWSDAALEEYRRPETWNMHIDMRFHCPENAIRGEIA
ncbi:MAG: hypothetical protein LBB75_05370 [Oscillospiraceae bacterium]|jgi:hypothetical protein|nr:hypothetical protein [Oscillospiraceae bacterium]